MHRLVFASNNRHKLEEIRHLAGDRFEILSLKDIGCEEEIPEEEDTLEGNARAKSRFIFDKYGIDCFADDTGLEIDALNGRPGVKSARYAGPECIADNNIRKILGELSAVSNRKARFRTVVCLILSGREFFFEGIVEGEILTEKRGKEGFGYDPVFRPEGYDLTFAEMPLELKNQISHRGKAIAGLIDFLKRPLVNSNK